MFLVRWSVRTIAQTWRALWALLGVVMFLVAVGAVYALVTGGASFEDRPTEAIDYVAAPSDTSEVPPADCWTHSIAASARADAYRCHEVGGNVVYDPCFALDGGPCAAIPTQRGVMRGVSSLRRFPRRRLWV